MNQTDALIVLIKATHIFTDNQKMKLLSTVRSLTEDQINILGKFLAEEKLQSVSNAQEIIQNLNIFESDLQEQSEALQPQGK